MSIFSNIFKRSQQENVTNPCPIPQPAQQDPMPAALNSYLDKNTIAPMNLSTFFAAVNLVSNSLAMMDWKFKDDLGNELSNTHYLYHLFEGSQLSRFNIMKDVIQDMILYGNGFIYIERDSETGRPKTLRYSPARQTAMWYNEITHRVYYNNILFTDRWDDGTNYLHFFMNTDDGYIGKGVMKYAYNVLDIASTIQKATNSYYATSGQMFGIVTPNGELPNIGNKQKQIDDLKRKWDDAQQHASKGTVFFPSDLKYIPTSTNAKDSSLIEAREYNAVEVGRFVCNLSPTLLGDLRHNVYGQLAESQKEFILHSLAPIVSMFEAQCNMKLIMPSKIGKQFIDLDENSILATDQEKQATTCKIYADAGIKTRNEIRKELGLPPVDGGDALAVPYSSINDNIIGETKTTTTQEDE